MIPLLLSSPRGRQGRCAEQAVTWLKSAFGGRGLWYNMCGFIFSKFLCIYSAVLGLHCCAGAFSSCGEQGLLSSWGAQASPFSGFSCCRAWALGQAGFSSCSSRAQSPVAIWDLSGQTCVPCRWILNHWTTTEVPMCRFLMRLVNLRVQKSPTKVASVIWEAQW